MYRLKGVSASPGIVIGKALKLAMLDVDEEVKYIEPNAVEEEIKRLETALAKSVKQLEGIKERLKEEDKGDSLIYNINILDVHILILRDTSWLRETEDFIRREKLNAESALRKVVRKWCKVFDEIDDEYLRTRRADIEHAADRLLGNLIGKTEKELPKKLANIEEEVIIVAHDLTPADTAHMHHGKVIAFATDLGGRTSHTAIMARSLEIPAVVGLKEITARVVDGDCVIVDGNEGTVIVNPIDETFRLYLDKQKRYKYFEEELLKLRELPAETLDGYRLDLEANIEFPDEINSAMKHGTFGVGLYRTEFLYMNRDTCPTEEEHFVAYRMLAEMTKSYGATIRTLDLGGDKFGSCLEFNEEENPALGLRAVRFCLSRMDIFRTQIRAILRASVHGNLRILFPMISGVYEYRKARAVVMEVANELKQDSIPFDENIKMGVMIEVPSAAITADLLAKEADFFSIGTNDLIQYTIAIDRTNDKVFYLYEPLHPAIIRLIQNVITAAHNEGIWVGMCGEMAGDPMFCAVLMGLGLDGLSMNAVSIPTIKRIVRSMSLKEATDLAHEVMDLSTTKEVERHIANTMFGKFPEIFHMYPSEEVWWQDSMHFIQYWSGLVE